MTLSQVRKMQILKYRSLYKHIMYSRGYFLSGQDLGRETDFTNVNQLSKMQHFHSRHNSKIKIFACTFCTHVNTKYNMYIISAAVKKILVNIWLDIVDANSNTKTWQAYNRKSLLSKKRHAVNVYRQKLHCFLHCNVWRKIVGQ